VLIKEIDHLDPQALERAVGDLANVLRATVEATRASRTEVVTELGGDGDLAPIRLQRLANELLVGEGAIPPRLCRRT
jgi:hypothetical protein